MMMKGLLRRCLSSQVNQVQIIEPPATAARKPRVSVGDKIKALTEKYERLSRMLDIEETNRNQLVI